MRFSPCRLNQIIVQGTLLDRRREKIYIDIERYFDTKSFTVKQGRIEFFLYGNKLLCTKHGYISIYLKQHIVYHLLYIKKIFKVLQSLFSTDKCTVKRIRYKITNVHLSGKLTEHLTTNILKTKLLTVINNSTIRVIAKEHELSFDPSLTEDLPCENIKHFFLSCHDDKGCKLIQCKIVPQKSYTVITRNLLHLEILKAVLRRCTLL